MRRITTFLLVAACSPARPPPATTTIAHPIASQARVVDAGVEDTRSVQPRLLPPGFLVEDAGAAAAWIPTSTTTSCTLSLPESAPAYAIASCAANLGAAGSTTIAVDGLPAEKGPPPGALDAIPSMSSCDREVWASKIAARFPPGTEVQLDWSGMGTIAIHDTTLLGPDHDTFSQAEIDAWSRFVRKHACLFGLSAPSDFYFVSRGGAGLLGTSKRGGYGAVVADKHRARGTTYVLQITGHFWPVRTPADAPAALAALRGRYVGQPVEYREKRGPVCDSMPGAPCGPQAVPRTGVRPLEARDLSAESEVGLVCQPNGIVRIHRLGLLALVGDVRPSSDTTRELPRTVNLLTNADVSRSTTVMHLASFAPNSQNVVAGGMSEGRDCNF